ASVEELGWSLKAIYTTTNNQIGVIIGLDDITKPLPKDGSVVTIVEDNVGVYGASNLYCCNGVIFAMDDIFFLPVQGNSGSQHTTASWSDIPLYGEFPQLMFEWMSEAGATHQTSVLLSECSEGNQLRWPF
ncbi:MAG: hypothetical protein AAGJ93_10875, partial [Bacteroidota bacterium]